MPAGILEYVLNFGVPDLHHDDHSATTSFLTAKLDPAKLEFRELYAEGCVHCQHLKPAWQSAVDQYTQQGGKTICNKQNLNSCN